MPRIVPTSVIEVWPRVRAMPKSVTLTSRPGETMTLPGLMSRCTTPAAVRGSEGGADLGGDGHRLVGLEPTAATQQGGEVGAGGELHDDEVLRLVETVAVHAVVVDLGDGRVEQAGDDDRLAAEALDGLRGRAVGAVEQLDGDRSGEALVGGDVDLAHAADSEPLAEHVASGEPHRRGGVGGHERPP